MYKNKQRESLGEQGFAALIISIVIVTVLSLITVGFAQLMRHEQQAALDRQLNSEAYYAAESGINDANRALQGGYVKAKTACGNDASAVDYSISGSEYLKNTNVDGSSGSSYSCLLINPSPSDLQYSSIPVNQATTAIATGADASGNTVSISKLVFSWQDDTAGRTFAGTTGATGISGVGNSKFPALSDWKAGTDAITGMLRVSVTPMANLNRSALLNNTYTAFLYPQFSGVSRTIGTAVSSASAMDGNTGVNSGPVLDGHCNTDNKPRFCSVAIDLGSYAGTDFLIHMSSIYRPTAVTVTPYDNLNNKIYIKGAQTLIDSTGKVQDVLKRIQVRVPARNGFDWPEFGVQTTNDICKQVSTYPPNFSTGTAGQAVNACGSL